MQDWAFGTSRFPNWGRAIEYPISNKEYPTSKGYVAQGRTSNKEQGAKQKTEFNPDFAIGQSAADARRSG